MTQTEHIRETVNTLLAKMGFSAMHVEVRQEDSAGYAQFVCDIITERDSRFLIGQQGANLAALEHLCRVIVKKHYGTGISIGLDVNHYAKEKMRAAVTQAEIIAKQVLHDARAVRLSPMSPRERRAVHAALADVDGIATQSEGVGPERCVVVKPT